MFGKPRVFSRKIWVPFLLGGMVSGCVQERWEKSVHLIGMAWQGDSSVRVVWDVEREKYMHNPYDPVTPYDARLLVSVTVVWDLLKIGPSGLLHRKQRNTSTCTGEHPCIPLAAVRRPSSVGGPALVICGTSRCWKYEGTDVHQIEEIPVRVDGLRSLRLSVGGKYLAATYTDRTELWDLARRQKILSWDQPVEIYWDSREEDRFCAGNGLFTTAGDTLSLLPAALPCVGVGPLDSLTILDTVLNELKIFDHRGIYGRSIATDMEISEIFAQGVRWNTDGTCFLVGNMLLDQQGRVLLDFPRVVQEEGGLP